MFQCLVLSCRDFAMADSIMSKAATMEIPINSNGDTGTLPEDDSLEQVSWSHFSHFTDNVCLINLYWHLALSWWQFSILFLLTVQSRTEAG